MSPASINKRIEQIENHLNKLKLLMAEVEIKNAAAPKKPKAKSEPKKKDKPATIRDCVKKSDLSKFTVKELKAFIKENAIDIKELSKKHKEDLVKAVWKALKASANTEESESSESESSSDSSDSDSESD
jgi:type II secretory pathway component PulM